MANELESIRRRIRKLLALAADTPHEEEKQTALLKAQKLMMEYSLSQSELGESELSSEEVIQGRVYVGKVYSEWKAELAYILSKNFVCEFYSSRRPKAKEQYVVFLGRKTHVELCQEMFSFAQLAIMFGVTQFLRERKKEEKVSIRDGMVIRKSWIDGFLVGLHEQFNKQKKENPEWGLVLVPDAEVQAAFQAIDLSTRASSENTLESDFEAYHVGKQKGSEFQVAKEVKG